MRQITPFVNPNDQTERECMRLAGVLSSHEAKWREELAAITKATGGQL